MKLIFRFSDDHEDVSVSNVFYQPRKGDHISNGSAPANTMEYVMEYIVVDRTYNISTNTLVCYLEPIN